MKKIVQAGLILSGLASSLVAYDQIEHEPVRVSQDDSIELTFTSPYPNPVISIGDVGENFTGDFSISLADAPDAKYTISLKSKTAIPSCSLPTFAPIENKEFILNIIPSNLGDGDIIYHELITYPTCYGETPTPPPDFHFETEHPYANNTHTVEELPPLCAPGGLCTTQLRYAVIHGEIENNYDFITISQGGQVLARLTGVIDTQVEINSSLPTTITFDSDNIITKSGVTVDLGAGFIEAE